MPFLTAGFTSKLKQGATALDIFNLIKSKDSDSTKNDPDEKWSNLYRERQRNHIYKWVDVNKGSKGGELLETYDKEGEEGIIRFANEKISPLLFNDGTLLEKIRLNDYMKWKKALDANISGNSEESDSNETLEAQKKFIEHFAQWRLNKRGIDGETVIHLLLSRDDAKCADIAKMLIKLYPGLAVDIYEGDEFYGQSPLHLAIIHDDYEMVSILLDAGADIKGRATGRFFLPEDQKRPRKPKFTNYSGFAYYGEYPLAFAASFGNKDIYDFLVQHGADPNAQDSFGNTVLHICVINNSIEMYSYAVRHWSKPADPDICNFIGYTPLTLATILGRREIFEAMLELTKVEFWRFCDMACSAYPLTTLDTILPDGSTNWDSALMRVVSGSTADHMDIVGSEVIQRLLADKWRSFGYKKMYQRMIFLIFHLLILSIAIYTRPDEGDNLWGRHEAGDIVRYFFECILLASSSVFLFYQQGSEIRAQGVRGYLKTLVRAPDKILFLISNILIMFCIPCRLSEQYTTEETLLVLALPGSWTYLLFFAKGYLLTGPFVIMIYSMLSGDMVRFAVISLIFLVSFSQAFFFLGKDMKERQDAGKCAVSKDDHVIDDYDAYVETALTLIRMGLGGYDYEDFECASYRGFAKLLFVIYMIIMPIMLINMLIAMMGNTYTTIISQAEKAWFQQWAQLVIQLERALDKEKLAQYQAEYSIKLNDDRTDLDDPGAMETRALMVIKQTKKTRARQRKQATASWKRLSRKVLAMIRTHTTDRTRDILHSHGQLPPSLLMSSRPISAAGFHPSHAAMLHHHNNRNLLVSAIPGRRSNLPLSHAGSMDHSITITHVVDTMRSSPVLPPPPGIPFERTSPQFMVHQVNTISTIDPVYAIESQTPTAKNRFSQDYQLSIDLPVPPVASQPQPLFTSQFPMDLQQNEPQNLDAIPEISSPNSPSTSKSSAGSNQDRPPSEIRKRHLEDTNLELRKLSIQLQPLNVEQLPTAFHRPRGPQIPRKGQFASKQPIGRGIAQPNLPPAHQKPLAISLSEPGTGVTMASGIDRHVTTPSPFLQSSSHLPNMPQAQFNDEETTSFHDEEYETGSTTGIVSPRKTGEEGSVRKKTTSPPATHKVSPGKKKTRASIDQGKRAKKKP